MKVLENERGNLCFQLPDQESYIVADDEFVKHCCLRVIEQLEIHTDVELENKNKWFKVYREEARRRFQLLDDIPTLREVFVAFLPHKYEFDSQQSLLEYAGECTIAETNYLTASERFSLVNITNRSFEVTEVVVTVNGKAIDDPTDQENLLNSIGPVSKTS